MGDEEKEVANSKAKKEQKMQKFMIMFRYFYKCIYVEKSLKIKCINKEKPYLSI